MSKMNGDIVIFEDLCFNDREEVLDGIYYDIFDQKPLLADGLLIMPFDIASDCKIGDKVATLGEKGVVSGSISNISNGCGELYFEGEPYNFNLNYAVRLH